MNLFQDRLDAARQLQKKLLQYKNAKDTVLLAIPRGGLELGHLLAKELHLPLDIILSKKIGYPGNPEFAIGAVSLDRMVVNERYIESGEVSKDYIDHEVQRLQSLLQERYKKYRGKKAPPSLEGKTVIVVDDGVATGQTLLLTLTLLREQRVKKIVVAIPVGPLHTVEKLKAHADEVICLLTPEDFHAIGQFYIRFDQVEEETAIRLFQEANP